VYIWNQNWFIPSIILPPTPFLFLSWLQHVSVFHIHIGTENTSATRALPLTWLVLHSCPSLFRYLFIFWWGFWLGILPVNRLCLSQSNPLDCFSSPFSPTLYCSTVFSMCCCVLFLHRCDVFCYYSLLFFSSFAPPLVSS
jgi:hypothetical protein